MISIIAAIDESNGIGLNGKLPWKLPSDLKRFKQLTSLHPVIMGRITHWSIGKCLPLRRNIVVTSSPSGGFNPCLVSSIEEAVEVSKENGSSEVFVIGGASIYSSAINFADRLYISHIEGSFSCDTFFPKIDDQLWVKVSEERIDNKKDQCGYTFCVYDRIVGYE